MANFEFNEEAFIAAATTSEVGSTKAKLPPEGDYPAVVSDFQVKSGVIGKGKNIGKPWVSFVYKLEFTDERVTSVTGISPTVRSYSIFLDLTEDSTFENAKPDFREGRNLQFQRFRAAVGLNEPGVEFNPRMPVGRGLLAKISWIPKKDATDPTERVADITGVAKLPS